MIIQIIGIVKGKVGRAAGFFAENFPLVGRLAAQNRAEPLLQRFNCVLHRFVALLVG